MLHQQSPWVHHGNIFHFHSKCLESCVTVALTYQSFFQRIVHFWAGSVLRACVFSLTSEFGSWFSMPATGTPNLGPTSIVELELPCVLPFVYNMPWTPTLISFLS